MQEEQDTCRICSAPAEPDQPLFYPCKCSGTIRYIHQDCLTTWLAHSKKKTCDVCKYPYSFTKVYAPNMPSRLPFLLLLRRLAQQACLVILFALRAVLVACIWLAFLPWATIWTWRMYFTVGDSTAWWISSRPRPPQSTPVYENRTFTAQHNQTGEGAPWPLSLLSHPAVIAVSADIVSGQIIATVIVVAFVAVFLLREWISQNARPGVFDDAEGPPEMQEVPLAPEVAARLEAILEREAQREDAQREAEREGRAAAPAVADNAPGDGFNFYGQRIPQLPEERIGFNAPADAQQPDDSRTLPWDWDFDASDDPGEGSATLPAINQAPATPGKGKATRLADWDALKADIVEGKKRRHSWGDAYGEASTSAEPIPSEPSTTAFNLAFPPEHDSETAMDVDPPAAPLDWTMDFSSWDPLRKSTTDAFAEASPKPAASASHTPKTPQTPSRQRPPLFSTALFPDRDDLSPSRLSSSSRSRGTTPLESPSLATYCAPEELGVGSSGLSDYFPRKPDGSESQQLDRDSGSTAREYDTYFREADEQVATTSEASGSSDGDFVKVLPIGRKESQDSEDMPALAQMTDPESDDDAEELEDEAQDRPADVEFDLFPDDFAEHDHADEAEDDQLDDLPPLADLQPVDPIDADEADIGMEDDMEGALEAIGLRGPIHAVLQNAALMIFVLDATIGIGIWFPFTIGKSLALLSLDPRRLLYILHFPIRAIRVMTDPVVDSFMFLFSRLVTPLLWRAVNPCLAFGMKILSSVMGEQGADQSVESFSMMFNRTAEAATNLWTTVLSPSDAPVTVEPTLLDKLLAPDSAFMKVAEPYFAPIGEMVRLAWEDLQASWVRLALGNGTTEKIFAVSLGYMVNAVLLALYLNVLTVGSMRSAGRAVRNAVRQQLLVVKVAAFIIVELVIFPLGCGIMLDICTVSLFPQGSLRGRLTFLLHAPLTSAFYHWVIGTMFMYQFAVLLAAFRTCLRSGALWFIKDPQDQNFHPIREILDRPALVHVRKLIISGFMYGCVIACSVGTVSAILRIFSQTIMPFRWKLREPLSVVPIDLLFLHLVLPYTLQYFRPRKFLKQQSVHVWKFLARQLRLSSYLFGGRHPNEEVDYTHSLIFGAQTHGLNAARTGTFRRVPNSDNIALVKGQPATVEVDEDGRPVNDKEARLMQLQDSETEKNKRNIKDDYTITYMPPHFRYRALAFVAGVWIICSIFLAAALAIPVLLGRGFFKLFVPYHVHDGYSFVAGFYLLWSCWLVTAAIDRMDRHRQRRGGDHERADLALYFVKRSLLWSAQAAYMAFFLGVVIPTLIAIVMELYVIMPVRHELHPDQRPTIRIVDMWALGLLYTKILLRVQRVQPMGRIARGVEAIRRNGWTHPDPIRATKEVIAPLTAGLLGMILLPPALILVVLKVTGLKTNESLLFLHVYPGICTLTAGILAAVAAYDTINSWQQTVRDKEFLVELRLQNLESEADAKAKMEATGDVTPVDDDEEE